MEERREILITQANNGYVLEEGRIGFPRDQILCCEAREKITSAVNEVVTDLWEDKEKK